MNDGEEEFTEVPSPQGLALPGSSEDFRQIAERLNVNDYTVYCLVEAGKLPGFKGGWLLALPGGCSAMTLISLERQLEFRRHD